MVRGRRITLTVSLARQDNTGGLDAETFSYGGGCGGVRVRAGSRLDGPKHAWHCARYGYYASTGTRRTGRPCTGTHRHSTGTHGTGTHRHSTGTHGTSTHRHGTGSRGAGTHRCGAGYDHDRAHDEEKEVCEDDQAAGDR
jgi:hypothetical protein